MFEEYKELTPLEKDPSKWTEDYYFKIGNELLHKNYAEKRFDFLRQMAKVIHADKIKRLKKERGE